MVTMRSEYPGFLNEWKYSRRFPDGLVHAMSPTKLLLRSFDTFGHRTQCGFSTYCAKGLSHNNLPGKEVARDHEPVTCVLCLAALKS